MNEYSGKSVLIIGAGLLQVPAIKAASEMGLTTVVTDYNDNAPGMKIADFPIIVSTKDIDGTVRKAKEFNAKHKIDGVITVGTDASMTVSAVANALKLPGIKFEDAEAASNKIKMRERLKQKKVPIPEFRKCWSLDELFTAASELSYPVVLKPADNMGARGVMKIENEMMLEKAYHNAKSASPSGELIVEEYMAGPELSIDALIYNSEIFITGIADRIIEREPYFIEIGHVMPSALDQALLDDAVRVFKLGIKALGLTIGAAKGDIKITKTGAKIGEIAARLSGGFMSAYTYPYSSGVNLIRNAIDISLGYKPSNLVPTRNHVAIERAIIPNPGIVKSIVGIDSAYSINGVKNVFVHVSIGDEVFEPKSNVEKPLNFIVVRENREEAWKTVEEVERVLAVVTDDKQRVSFQEINHKARERFNRACYACVECNGVECKGKIPGMGGYGSGASFMRNCDDVRKVLINTRVIHNVKTVNTSSNFFGIDLKIPLLIAPITGADINLGGQISELEYDEELLHGAQLSGVFAFVGDGAQPYLYRTGLEALKEVEGYGGAIFKPRKNQTDIIKRIKEAEDINIRMVGLDIDAAAFLTMEMMGQAVSTKTVYELKEIISSTNLPFIVKGIMTVEDAHCAVEAGAKAIVISNHGGRITDSHSSSISMLSAIKKAVDSKCKIILDGGLRSGEDIFKAIALGADYCMIGRPFAVSIVGGGRDGVKILVDKYHYELKRIMILTGAEKISDISENMVNADLLTSQRRM